MLSVLYGSVIGVPVEELPSGRHNRRYLRPAAAKDGGTGTVASMVPPNGQGLELSQGSAGEPQCAKVLPGKVKPVPTVSMSTMWIPPRVPIAGSSEIGTRGRIS